VKTWITKASDVQREWFVIDAAGQTLGRLATQVATLLKADQVQVTGRKLDQKVYYRYSGYPGGLKSISLRDQLDQYPERVLRAAVRGMLPHNRLGRLMFKKLKVYRGADHPHAAQQPKQWTGSVEER
jgi:large subunit ribosomal protein L13